MKKTVINEILITLLKNTRIKQIMIHILSTYNLHIYAIALIISLL
jgi:hypothetical protein